MSVKTATSTTAQGALVAISLLACSEAEPNFRPPAVEPDRAPQAPVTDSGEPGQGVMGFAERYAEVPRGKFDPLTIPFDNGIVWYGTWEDAMAEKQRTGKPVMLHFGSPRCPSGSVCVPGTW